MGRYLSRRLLETVLVVFLALSAVFFMLRLTGDPVLLFMPTDSLPQQIEQVRQDMGFNDPLLVQYARFIGRAAMGDFGKSLRHGEPAMPLLLERYPATLELTMVSLLLSLVIAVPAGVIAAARRNSLFDSTATFLSVLGQAIPGFWLGIMAIVFFAAKLHWLPSSGTGTWKHLVLPTTTLAAYTGARFVRITRSTVLDVLSQEYIRTARSKGLTEKAVLFKHALKNAGIPILTLLGLQVGQLMGGAVVTETVFAWPGVGRLIVQALLNRDFPLVSAGVFTVAALVALINLVVDIAYSAVNPQVRFQ
jgi:peptide/nickel transport system permease protein